MDIYVCSLKRKIITSLIFLFFVALFYRSEQVILKWKYKGSLGNLVSLPNPHPHPPPIPPPPLFIREIKLLNLRQSWGNKNLTYESENVTWKGKGGNPYKGGGSTTFCPFSLSWYWKLFDIEWNRKLFCHNKSSITGAKIMAAQQA